MKKAATTQKKQHQPRQRVGNDFTAMTRTYYRPNDTTAARPRRPAGSRNEPAKTEPQTTADDSQKKRWFTWKKVLLLLIILLITPFIVLGVWNARNFSYVSEKLFGTSNALAVVPPVPLAQDEQGRTNILLVGYSADDPNHAGATLTDSIMVLSLDGKNKKGYMLSIPRDLYVDIPNYGYAKINEAYQSEGIDTLQSVVSENFGIEVHHHMIINYASVRDTVDALGGVTVNIQSPDERGLYDPNFQPQEGGPLQLANGPQKIDGQTALRLTRARGATYGSYGFPQSDFNRVQNQQLVLAAIKNELSWQDVLDPRINEPIFKAIGDNIRTDIAVNQSIPFFRLFQSVPTSSLTQVNLREFNGQNLLRSYTTRSGQAALVPAAGVDDYSAIQAAIDAL